MEIDFGMPDSDICVSCKTEFDRYSWFFWQDDERLLCKLQNRMYDRFKTCQCGRAQPSFGMLDDERTCCVSCYF